MKIYLSDQKQHLKQHLEFFKTSEVMNYYNAPLKVKISSIPINAPQKFNPDICSVLFNYKIFPGSIMKQRTQWADENREMKIGDTIAQQVYIPPVASFSQKIVFGVRICGIINEPGRTGFSYETLEGHVENGISTFTLEQIDKNLIFKIQTCSMPGNHLTRFFNPVFSSPYQAYCTRQALRHVKRQIEHLEISS